MSGPEPGMQGLQAAIDSAVDNGDAPFVVAGLARAGQAGWFGGAGDAANGRAAGYDTVFRIFSMSKAAGAVMAAILVDRGRLSFDTPVADILPEFGDVRVLDGWDGDTPRLRAPRTVCTIGHLASHTSGFAYEFWNADLQRHLAATGNPTVFSGRNAALAYPLAFDPGTAWAYGIGIDWLGKAVEAADGRRVDRFAQDEILAPLGMADTSFELRDDQRGRLASVHARTDTGFRPSDLLPPSEPEFYGMGHALFSTAADIMRLLRMLLGGGALDGVRILSKATVDALLANQTGDLAVRPLTSVAPRVSADLDMFPGRRLSHSYLALRTEEDVPGMRASGGQGWAGILNTHYWIDPRNGVAGLFMTQLKPFADPRLMAAYAGFERAAYAAR